jgi:hypothetical protein
VFPPNRVIREGEPACRLCGSGRSTHDDGSRAHAYEGPKPLAWGDVATVVLWVAAVLGWAMFAHGVIRGWW